MFTVEMLAAGNGDALWIEYGQPGDRHRILVDGGTDDGFPALQAKLQALQDAGEPIHFDLIVVTHIDNDHIVGVLKMLEDPQWDATFDDFWFNGFKHLDPELEDFGPLEGERLTAAVMQKPWNVRFGGNQVALGEGDVPVEVELPGGMKCTILSPDAARLRSLRPEWNEAVREEGLIPGQPAVQEEDEDDLEPFGAIDVDDLASKPFHQDRSKKNASSIVMLLEHNGKTVLLGGDAIPGVVVPALKKLTNDAPLSVDACKLPHHGSKANVNRALVEQLDCRNYLFSSNGDGHSHPNREAVARVLRFGSGDKCLVFNYRSEFTEIWEDAELQAQESYTVRYPDAGQEGILLVLD